MDAPLFEDDSPETNLGGSIVQGICQDVGYAIDEETANHLALVIEALEGGAPMVFKAYRPRVLAIISSGSPIALNSEMTRLLALLDNIPGDIDTEESGDDGVTTYTFIGELKQSLGLSSDDTLSTELGMGRSTLSRLKVASGLSQRDYWMLRGYIMSKAESSNILKK